MKPRTRPYSKATRLRMRYTLFLLCCHINKRAVSYGR